MVKTWPGNLSIQA